MSGGETRRERSGYQLRSGCFASSGSYKDYQTWPLPAHLHFLFKSSSLGKTHACMTFYHASPLSTASQFASGVYQQSHFNNWPDLLLYLMMSPLPRLSDQSPKTRTLKLAYAGTNADFGHQFFRQSGFHRRQRNLFICFQTPHHTPVEMIRHQMLTVVDTAPILPLSLLQASCQQAGTSALLSFTSHTWHRLYDQQKWSESYLLLGLSVVSPASGSPRHRSSSSRP